MRTQRSSTLPTSSADAFRAFTKSSAAKDSWKVGGALIPARNFPQDKLKSSIEFALRIAIYRMTTSSRSIFMNRVT